ncbi:hypothetical protein Ga0609869_001226 [Rhodovulum iodosum]|uniref:Cytochrome c oxidase subunit IV bacterial aa3 type domain-containing protein n=1 Tax=Rhodovulum iodosum TaxID=68291 RepID=A0ABV3XU56_9RHOB|nr:aa3-type cytochrome c oxidase subunit IV [Rhodovulum robiginosum]RSK32715.1 aa3-type cytochrome c oxidase subunit IV [Rhodovulum robiginosum]
MAEHRSGSMDTDDHERTFAAFVRFVVRAVVLIIGILIFMAIVNG